MFRAKFLILSKCKCSQIASIVVLANPNKTVISTSNPNPRYKYYTITDFSILVRLSQWKLLRKERELFIFV